MELINSLEKWNRKFFFFPVSLSVHETVIPLEICYRETKITENSSEVAFSVSHFFYSLWEQYLLGKKKPVFLIILVFWNLLLINMSWNSVFSKFSAISLKVLHQIVCFIWLTIVIFNFKPFHFHFHCRRTLSLIMSAQIIHGIEHYSTLFSPFQKFPETDVNFKFLSSSGILWKNTNIPIFEVPLG